MIERKPDGTIDIDSLDTVDHYRDHVPPLMRKVVLLITGAAPGTGASTAESMLAKTIGLEEAGAGLYQRAIALHFKQFFETEIALAQVQDPELDLGSHVQKAKVCREIWKKFSRNYFTSELQLQSIEGIKVRLDYLIQQHHSALYDQANLVFFRENQRKYGLNHQSSLVQQVSREFDKIPDLISYQALTKDVPENKLGLGVEGKLVTRIDDIAEVNLKDNNRDVYVPLETSDDMAVVRLFLQVNELESAKRVLQRQIIKGAITPPAKIDKQDVINYLKFDLPPQQTEDIALFETWIQERIELQRAENTKRMHDDYERWSVLYGVPLSAKYLQEKADAVIDTSDLDEVGTALAALEVIAELVPELSHVIMDCLAEQFRAAQLHSTET